MDIGTIVAQNYIPKIAAGMQKAGNNVASEISRGGEKLSNTLDGLAATNRCAVKSSNISPIKKFSKILSSIYSSKIGYIGESYKEFFSGIGDFSARAKSSGSVECKLERKLKDKPVSNRDGLKKFAKIIGDGYGTRITLSDLTSKTTEEILKKYNFTIKEFQKLALGEIDDIQNPELKERFLDALTSLKETQTQSFVDRLVCLIKEGKINLADDDFNNYGTELTSYLTNKQLAQIAKAHEEATNTPMTFVNKIALSAKDFTKGDIRTNDPDLIKRYLKVLSKEDALDKLKKADKSGGYAGTQFNISTKYTLGEKKLGDTEMQVRGALVHQFAEVEHAIYDIRQKKITPQSYNFEKYKNIYNAIRYMDVESYESYVAYLRGVYKALRLSELGITTKIPQFPKNLRFTTDKEILQTCTDGSIKAGGPIENAQKLISESALRTLK